MVSETKNSADVRKRVIGIVHDYLPITARKSRSFIEQNADKELVSFFGISSETGHHLVEELEAEFDLKDPTEVEKSTKETEKRFLWMRRTIKESPYHLVVPNNVTVEQLCDVAFSGVWPLSFYSHE